MNALMNKTPSQALSPNKFAALAILTCGIPAAFRPKKLVNGYEVPCAMDVEFNALPALAALKYEDFREMFCMEWGFEQLAAGLEERDAHEGPFEVLIEKHDVFRAIGLLTGKSINGVWDIGRSTWDQFVAAISMLNEHARLHEGEWGEQQAYPVERC
jgi:hypothetical protein